MTLPPQTMTHLANSSPVPVAQKPQLATMTSPRPLMMVHAPASTNAEYAVDLASPMVTAIAKATKMTHSETAVATVWKTPTMMESAIQKTRA